MKKNVFWIIPCALLIVVVVICFFKANRTNEDTEPVIAERLHIVTTTYINGVSDDDGVCLTFYLYNISDDTLNHLADIQIHSTYPVAFADISNNRIIYSDSESLYDPDNLFIYDIQTKESTQITFGKNLYNDLFITPYGDVFMNVARRYASVTQPAIIDLDSMEIIYLDENDDDTWCYSLSYNYATNKLLRLACSNAEMRTYKVAAETHIRPKSIISMDTDFANQRVLFSTEDYEIRLVRELDENRILMTTDPFMGSGALRKLKLLYVDTGEVVDFEIPGIKEVYSFYPRYNAEGVFIIGRTTDNEYGLFYYDLINECVTAVFSDNEKPENHRALVDFVYSAG